MTSDNETPLEHLPDERLANARYLLKPYRQAAWTLAEANEGVLGVGVAEMALSLSEMTRTIQGGDTKAIEGLLYCQAMTLDAICNRLLRTALAAVDGGTVQTRCIDLALRAQKQSRNTAAALLSYKNKNVPAVTIGQQNIAGQMQVNIGIPVPRENGTNELLAMDNKADE